MPARLRRRAALCLIAAQPLLPPAAQAASEAVTLEELSVEGEGRGRGGPRRARRPKSKKISASPRRPARPPR